MALLHGPAATGAGEPPPSEPPSLAELERRADDGDARAALMLGMRYRDGEGVDRDYGQAVRWYRRCADLGDPDGMDNVGFMYLRGWGVPRSAEIAAGFFKAGGEQSHPQALFNLGECYHGGRGVDQDCSRAIDAWSRAAQAGHDNALWRLAMMRAAGEGGPRDPETAEDWCRRLAERGHANGMLLLGELLALRGDRDGACGWWRKARDAGSTQGGALLELAEWRWEPPVAGGRVFVPVDHIYQGWNNCGATSMAMFLRQAGGTLGPYDVKRMCPQSPIGTGTDWEHLAAVGREIGQCWKIIVFPHDDPGFVGGVREIRSRLDRRQPVVIDFTVTKEEDGRVAHYGHTLLVVGYNAERDRYVLKNPNQPSPGIELMTGEALKANWRSGGYSHRAGGRVARPLIVHGG